MEYTALMIVILVVGGMWYTGRRPDSAKAGHKEEPLVPIAAYLALFGVGLVLALLVG